MAKRIILELPRNDAASFGEENEVPEEKEKERGREWLKMYSLLA